MDSFPLPQTFRQVLKRARDRDPERPAAIFGERILTYGELWERAHRLAYALFRLGIRKGDKVTLWMPNTLEWIIAWWAVPMIGAVVVPLDHWYREIEAQHIINHSDSRMVITCRPTGKWDFLSMLKEIEIPQVEYIISAGAAEKISGIEFEELVQKGEGWWEDEAFLHTLEGISPEEVGIILYTSGTTGNPKGVMLSQYQIIKNAYDQGSRMEVSERDSLVVTVPFSHCFGCVMSITLMANFAGTLIPLLAFDERKALEAVETYKGTMIYGTPTMFGREMKLLRKEKFDTSSLRTGIMAGAPCPEDLMRAVQEEMGVNLCITYGLTEASPGITMTSLKDTLEDRVKTVGYPLPQVEVRIVDAQGRELGPGEVGEITCRGYNVMKGYYKAPELTGEVIKGGWLYTGDLGMMDERGYITFKGRKKELVITGGINVYPIEVEGFIRQMEKVHEVAVVGVPDEDLGEVVACAVIPKEGVELTPQEVVDFCYGKIASPKVPRYVHLTPALPLNGRGKIQKYILQDMLKDLIQKGRLQKIIPTQVREKSSPPLPASKSATR